MRRQSDMKIAIIPTWYNNPKNPLTGVFFKEQAAALRAGGVDAAILFPDLAPRLSGMAITKSFAVEDGTPTFRLTGFYPPKIYPFILKSWAEKAASLYADYFERFGKPDLVHAHSYLAGYVALKIARKYGVPYIFTEHNSTFLAGQTRKWLAPYVSEILDHAEARTAVSKGMKERMASFTKLSIQVIPNFIDTAVFKPATRKREKGGVVFFSAGGLDPVKGYDGLIRAFGAMPNPVKGGKLSLRIAGAGREKRNLQRLILEGGLMNDVNLLGELDRPQMVREMQEADVFVSSSQIEPFGVVMIEAMGCGKPILATETDGARDIVTAQTGRLVPVGNTEALTEGLKYMADHYQDLDREEIRRLCVEQYGAEAVVKKWIAVYSDVIG